MCRLQTWLYIRRRNTHFMYLLCNKILSVNSTNQTFAVFIATREGVRAQKEQNTVQVFCTCIDMKVSLAFND